MSKNEIIWVVCNTNSIKEADKIGRAALKERLCACYSILPRIRSVYYWPPKSKKLEQSKGPFWFWKPWKRTLGKSANLLRVCTATKCHLLASGKWKT